MSSLGFLKERIVRTNHVMHLLLGAALSASCIFSAAVAQPFPPDSGPLYTTAEIPEIRIQIDPDSLDYLYDPADNNWYSNHEYPATFIFKTQAGSDTLTQVGLRFRGNTSRLHIKKSFKISFNTYVPGRKYHQEEKLNLNAEVNDPSMLRSHITMELYRLRGVAAPRSNHVRLYINGTYYGLYQNTEHIDEEFAATWFGSKKGNLYKCTYPANLGYVSANPDAYKFTSDGERVYELKTNRDLDDYSDLARFIRFLNLSDAEVFRCEVADYFDVYGYLKIAAIDVMTGNWDGYIYNQNNYYLYDNPLTRKMIYIPYDTDNTWGIDWLGINWTNRNPYSWGQSNRPLFNRLMDETVFRDIFTWQISDLLENYFNTPERQAAIENLHAFITQAALSDPYRPLDFGWTTDDFNHALSQGAGGHVPYGVLQYADLREVSAGNQLENVIIAPVIAGVEVDFSDSPDILTLQCKIDGPAAGSAWINYSINGGTTQNASGSATDQGYLFTISPGVNNGTLNYNITVNGLNGMSRDAWCATRSITFQIGSGGLVINEILASNQSGITDASGDHTDWIELYNKGTAPVNLSKYYLSDADRAPLKWNLPDLTMEPGTHLLIYADGQIGKGPLHANFKVRASGDRIYLFKKDDNSALLLADKVDMPALPGDYSFGRAVDGDPEWVIFPEPTPDAPNGEVSLAQHPKSEHLHIYPNPATSILHFSRSGTYVIRDISGRMLLNGKGSTVNVENLSSGFYFIEIDSQIAVFQKL